MAIQLEPACYMAHEQAYYTFQPQFSQQSIRKPQVAFHLNLTYDLAATVQRLDADTCHASTVEF